jgi:hypothetical protein
MCIRPPGRKLIQGDKPLKRFSEILLLNNISPIKTNNGRANIVELFVLFHKILVKIVREGLLVKYSKENIATIIKDIPTQTLPASRATKTNNTVNDIPIKLKTSPPFLKNYINLP